MIVTTGMVFAMLAATACGRSASPIGPSAPTDRPLALADGLTVSSLSLTGQLVQGQVRYRPDVTLAAGSVSVTVTRISFEAAGGGTLGDLRMAWAIPAGGSWRHNPSFDLLSDREVLQVTARVSFVTDAGLPREVSATAAVEPIGPRVPSTQLRLSVFSVLGYREGTDYAYWPKLTLNELAGVSALTVRRLQFQLLGVGAAGNVPPFFREWTVPRGGELRLFHNLFYGDPEFYITSRARAEEVSVVVSYTDEAGRSGDVSAVAPVSWSASSTGGTP